MNDSYKLSLKILLVEDDGISNFLATTKFKKLGFEKIQSVENGILAIDYLNNHTPNLIILDINMPIMDGFEFLDYKEKNSLGANTPIVILTSSNRESDREKILGYRNIVDYIEKPLNYEKIQRILTKINITASV
jgi:CheY-like chemotaxis protein